MLLNNKQEQGLRIAVERFNNREPYTCIAGYAGTGKSTLVKFIISALNLDPENDVTYVSYTGKASLVLQSKGCPNAQTAHKLLYKSYLNKTTGKFVHYPKRKLDDEYKLIIVDEISMLPLDMWELLLTHQIPVICLGDPFQLPPIGEDNKVLESPHIFLDEIMRQAQESEIVRLSMELREGKSLPLFKGNEIQIFNKNELVTGMYTWADQIICGTNATRHKINKEMRKMLYDTTDPIPVKGDKLICLRNDWERMNIQGEVLVNGLIGFADDVQVIDNVPFFNKKISCSFSTETDNPATKFNDLDLDYKIFNEGKPSVNATNFKQVPKMIQKPHEFDYGYAITAWKAQGSEYDKVLLIEEKFPFDKETHQRFLYTAVTRAAEKLTIIRQ